MDDDSADVIQAFEMLTPKKGKIKESIRLVTSAHVGSNAEIFPVILRLHIPDGSRITDVTYGRGAFWKFVPRGRYTAIYSDLNTGKTAEFSRVRKFDCRKLPYENESFDGVIFDPPYTPMHGDYNPMPEWYEEAIVEAARILRKKGTLVIKCQDDDSMISTCVNSKKLGLSKTDVFIVVTASTPGVTGAKKQYHSRRAHSYFLVFKK